MVEIVYKRLTLEVNPETHEAMRELAQRLRVHTVAVYDQACREFLSKPENYMGKDNVLKKGKPLNKTGRDITVPLGKRNR